MATHQSIVETLEGRQLLTFAALDPSYGVGGATNPGARDETVRVTYPLNDGTTIVEMEPGYLHLDAHGKVIKSFGGGDGVLTPTGADASTPVLAAVDAVSGRIVLSHELNGIPTLSVYNADGVLEREFTSGTNGSNLLDVKKVQFDHAGRLLVVTFRDIRRFDVKNGTADTTFGNRGVVALDLVSLPAGEPLESPHDGIPLVDTLALLIPPAGAPNAGGLTLVRTYRTHADGAAAGYAPGTYLELRHFTADGAAVTNGVNTVAIESSIANADGSTTLKTLDVRGLAAAADGSVTMLAETHESRSNAAHVTTAVFNQEQLFHVTDRLGKPRNLNAPFQVAMVGDGQRYGVPSQLVNTPDGKRAYVLIGDRIAQFSSATLKPFTSQNGTNGAIQLTVHHEAAFIAVDAYSRLLVNDAYRIQAVSGFTEGWNTPAAGATLLRDGTLVVSGTEKNDQVTVGYGSKQRIRVVVNGHTQYFARSTVLGVVVHTGSGNDNINASDLRYFEPGLYIQPGAGNDTVIGSPGNDTIDGGLGRDSLVGGAGVNIALGTGDDDSLTGIDRGESIFAVDPIPLLD